MGVVGNKLNYIFLENCTVVRMVTEYSRGNQVGNVILCSTVYPVAIRLSAAIHLNSKTLGKFNHLRRR